MAPLKQHIEALIFTAEQAISAEEIKKLPENHATSGDQRRGSEKPYCTITKQIQQRCLCFSNCGNERRIPVPHQKRIPQHPSNSTAPAKSQKSAYPPLLWKRWLSLRINSPITKAEVEHIRGVSSDYSMQKLLEKDLIEISGKSDKPGKPVLYSTNQNLYGLLLV